MLVPDRWNTRGVDQRTEYMLSLEGLDDAAFIEAARKALTLVATEMASAETDIPWEVRSRWPADVMEAAQAANVHDEIERMERGYETMLGRARDARGVSTGQKQRICIAAALLKNAPLLFLDEATSSLDAVSERRFQSALDRLMQGRTTFIIAHRLSTLRHADRIMVLEHGRLVGLDTHEELMRSCDVYRRLWTYQMGGATMERLEPVEL